MLTFIRTCHNYPPHPDSAITGQKAEKQSNFQLIAGFSSRRIAHPDSGLTRLGLALPELHASLSL